MKILVIVLILLAAAAIALSWFVLPYWEAISAVWSAASAIAVAATIFYVARQAKATEALAKSSLIPKVQVLLYGNEINPVAGIVSHDGIPGYLDIKTRVHVDGRPYKKEVEIDGKKCDTENLLAWPHRLVFPGLVIQTNKHDQFDVLFKDIEINKGGVEKNKVVITLIISLTPFIQKSGAQESYEKRYVYQKGEPGGRWRWENLAWGISEDLIARRFMPDSH